MIKVGSRVVWAAYDPSEPNKPIVGRVTEIEYDADGDPWYTLTFKNDHKDVSVERSEITPYRSK